MLNALRVSILSNNQQRLQKRFETFPFVDSDSKAAVEYQMAYEEYWQLQNERDALDIKAIDALMQSVIKYPDLYTELEALESKWLRKSTTLMQDPTTTGVGFKSRVGASKGVGVTPNADQYFAGGQSDIDALAKNVLAEEPTDSIHSEGQFQRLELLEVFVSDVELAKEIISEVNRIKAGLIEKDRAELMEEFQQVKQDWKGEIFGWDLERTEKEIQSLVVQKQNLSDDNGDLQQDIIQYKLDALQRHQNSLNGILVETELLRAQEDLDAARLKELEQSRSDEQSKVQSEIIRLMEIETKRLSEESERHRLIQSNISDVKIRLQQWDEDLDVWERLPPLDSSKNTKLLSLQQQIHQLQWDLQEEIIRLKSIERRSQNTIYHSTSRCLFGVGINRTGTRGYR